MSIKDTARNRIIKEWVGFNFVGWLLGMGLGPPLYYLILSNYLRSEVYEKLEPVFLSVPVGIGLGVMQYIKLRRWKVFSAAWIGATALGLGIPITLISWFLQDNYGNNPPLIAVAITILVTGLFIGGLQAILIHKLIAKPCLWILAYSLGLLAITVAVGMITVGALWGIEQFQYQIYSFGLGLLVDYFDVLLFLIIAFTSSVLAAIFIGIPTGIILQKSGNMKISSNDRENK